MTIYAIGDIHGHLHLLRQAHELVEADRARHGVPAGTQVVHVGDLVDRGAESRGVIEHLMEGIAAGAPWVVLLGNHDRMFLRFLRDPAEPEPGLRSGLSWLHPRLGGAGTLASYGVRAAADRPVGAVHADAVQAVPAEHRAFLEGAARWHRGDEAIFVHAGLRPGLPVERQDETDLVWIREPFLSDRRSHGALVVHGHTALDAPRHYGNRVNIDSGAAYGGLLTTVAIEGGEVFLLTPRGRAPLAAEGW